MPQFSVTLYRKVVSEQIAELKVDASSEAEARLKAAERAEAHRVTWEDHHPPDEVLYRVQVHPPE